MLGIGPVNFVNFHFSSKFRITASFQIDIVDRWMDGLREMEMEIEIKIDVERDGETGRFDRQTVRDIGREI